MGRIIGRDRSIIPACDVSLPQFEKILQQTSELAQVGAYKIGAVLAISEGLRKVVQTARRYTHKPLIYDHQKGGTDIPDTAPEFMRSVKECGVNAVILFPFSGPATQEAWTRAAQEAELAVIIGARMTHDRFLKSDGGYIDDSAVDSIVSNAAAQGIVDYVVPGNRPEVIQHFRAVLNHAGIEPVFYAPGFVAQGGTITLAAAAAGTTWHAIVGRAIYGASDMKRAALELAAAV
jgi:orotidine-5'-phosphate decarboxylase